MILSSQRGGARQLAVHLLKNDDGENDPRHGRATVASDTWRAPWRRPHAIAKSTRCIRPVCTYRPRPPKNAEITVEKADRKDGRSGRKGPGPVGTTASHRDPREGGQTPRVSSGPGSMPRR